MRSREADFEPHLPAHRVPSRAPRFALPVPALTIYPVRNHASGLIQRSDYGVSVGCWRGCHFDGDEDRAHPQVKRRFMSLSSELPTTTIPADEHPAASTAASNMRGLGFR